MEPLEDILRRGGLRAVLFASEFIHGDDRLVRTLQRLARRLSALRIPYAVTGDLAVIAHGYVETTCHVEVLLTEPDLERWRRHATEAGYVFDAAAPRMMSDAEAGVVIAIKVAGEAASRPPATSVRFPDPGRHSTEIEGVSFLDLSSLVRLKLAAGIPAPLGMRHLAEVLGLIQRRRLPYDLAENFPPPLRAEYERLWEIVEQDRLAPAR
jgi:hypothetical protein